jgi:toxin ParE1/3/4
MPVRIVWTERAVADLEEIERYIERDRPSAARRVAAHLVASVENLAEFPGLGKPGHRPGMRSLVTPPYVISYRVRSRRLEILSIWHGRRQSANLNL